MTEAASEGGTNFFDALLGIGTVAIAAFGDRPVSTTLVSATPTGTVPTNTILLLGGLGLGAVVLIFLLR